MINSRVRFVASSAAALALALAPSARAQGSAEKVDVAAIGKIKMKAFNGRK